jgi:hypothetical protein
MQTRRRISAIFALGLTLALLGPPARADLVWTVTLDTSQLATNYSGPFGVDFELVGSNGNTVSLSNFSFGTAGFAGPGGPFSTGGVSGDLSTSVTLNDSANFFNDFNQQFTPGDTLSFTVDSTTVAPPAGGTPDSFTMVLFSSYDQVNGYNPFTGSGGTPIPSTDPTGNDTLVSINVSDPTSTTVTSYPSAAGDINVNVTPQAVPEPSTVIMLLISLVSATAARRGTRLWSR